MITIDNPLSVETIWKPFRANTEVFNDVLPHHSFYPELLHNTEVLSYLVRSITIWEMTCGSLGHPGGSFSETETLSVLFNYVLRFKSSDPSWANRDIFYLSKCHACPSLYSLLALFGYFPLERLKYYGHWDSGLESHPDWTMTKGIEISGGSLGQIPGVGVGRAMGMYRKGPDHYDRSVYVLIGDGESNEGSVWEAFMAAGHYGLDNLVFIIDYNKVQAKGIANVDMRLEPLRDKLEAFNHDVYEVINGHDVSELVDTFTSIKNLRKGKPITLIINTTKGKKVSMCQFNPNWHTSAPRDAESATEWLTEVWERDGKRLGIPEEFPKKLGALIEKVPPLHSNPDDISEAQA